jgi:hypothetical protein
VWVGASLAAEELRRKKKIALDRHRTQPIPTGTPHPRLRRRSRSSQFARRSPSTAACRRDGERGPGAQAVVRGLRQHVGSLRHGVQAHHSLQRLREVHGTLPCPLPRMLGAHHQAHPGTDPFLRFIILYLRAHAGIETAFGGATPRQLPLRGRPRVPLCRWRY